MPIYSSNFPPFYISKKEDQATNRSIKSLLSSIFRCTNFRENKMKTDFEIRSLISDDSLINEETFVHPSSENGRGGTFLHHEFAWKTVEGGSFSKSENKARKKENKKRALFILLSSSSFFFFTDNKRSDRVENNFLFFSRNNSGPFHDRVFR